ncbi:MAG: hypothetical protein SFU57_05405 [Gemmatimonadales bacterium]|jgi:hypothetical protein|nr:hypothetical protein [Gemmatimonadales bacterium]
MKLQQLRLGLSAAGLALAVAAIATDTPWLIWAAIGVLTVSLGLRLIQRRDGGDQHHGPE